jgi:hypothetical protein
MKRILAVCLTLLCLAPLVAEDADNSTKTQEQETVQYEYKLNQPGDQYIHIALSGTFPLNFPNVASLFTGESQLKIGGIGSLGYHYFLTDSFAVGADASFGFNVTIGSHVFNFIPVLATATYQFSAGKFEFPLTLGIGVASESYIGYKYFPGLAIKPDVGFYYRLTPSWSLGAEIGYLFLPQFAELYDSSAHNIMGQFVTAGIAARYHF